MEKQNWQATRGSVRLLFYLKLNFNAVICNLTIATLFHTNCTPTHTHLSCIPQAAALLACAEK